MTYNFSYTTYNLLKKLKRHIFFLIRYTIFFKIKRHITDIDGGKCMIQEMGLRCVVESRVATAGMLMHKNPLEGDNRAWERGPHRSQEQVEILKELATLIAARTTRGRPGRASVAVQQRTTQFRLYSNFKRHRKK